MYIWAKVVMIISPKREAVARGFRKLRNEDFHILYSSRNIIRIIKSGEQDGRDV